MAILEIPNDILSRPSAVLLLEIDAKCSPAIMQQIIALVVIVESFQRCV